MSKTKKRDNYELWRTFVNTYKTLHRAVDRNLEPVGMRIQEMRLLFTLNNLGAVPMSVLAEEQVTTQASITGIVDDLEERGLVERIRSTEDRRVINVGITKKGKDALEKGLDSHREFIDKIMSVLTDREAEELSFVMNKLREAESKIKNIPTSRIS
jgi:MarR family transcriptional regulator, 2-MHQ and catechol-resistance regulon repressor